MLVLATSLMLAAAAAGPRDAATRDTDRGPSSGRAVVLERGVNEEQLPEPQDEGESQQDAGGSEGVVAFGRQTRLERMVVRVSSPQQPQTPMRRGQPSFEAHAITDLEISVYFARRVRGPHVLQIALYTPRGHLYQVIKVPFATASRSPGLRRMPGDPRTYREKVVTPGSGLSRVSARLPVAGTWIVTNGLFGLWRVEALLDDATLPSGAARFAIQP